MELELIDTLHFMCEMLTDRPPLSPFTRNLNGSVNVLDLIS